MFAVVRTGGKQYRVAPGDKIVVEKLDGSAGDQITLDDVLLAGDLTTHGEPEQAAMVAASSPIRNSLRRPNRSPARPPARSSPPNASA